MGTKRVLSFSRFGRMLACAAFLLLMSSLTSTVYAESGVHPEPFGNLRNYRIRSTYMETTDQGYIRLFCDGSKVCVEDYDDELKLTGTRSIEMELPIWGGFYKGRDAYYLIEGKQNENCIDGTEVIRIIKYDTAWNSEGAGSVRAMKDDSSDFRAMKDDNAEIRYPFEHSNVRCAEVEGKLYVMTGRQGYVDKTVGQGHQGKLLICMDESTFETNIVDNDYSHSFMQSMASKGHYIYLYEQSEGSRCTELTRYDTTRTGAEYDFLNDAWCSVFKYGGKRTSSWAIPCYSTADDVALSGENILGIGTSIDQSHYDAYANYGETIPYNIYLTVTPMSDLSTEATQVKWLTDYKKDNVQFIGVTMTKVNDDRFLVTWGEYEEDETLSDKSDSLSWRRMHYLFIDGSGNIVSKEAKVSAAFSDCHPIICGDNAVYCASSGTSVNFYLINTQTGEFSKKVNGYTSIYSTTVGKIPNQTYTGKAIEPIPVIKYKKKFLIPGKDYTVAYHKNTDIGTAKITIQGIGKYCESGYLNFRIVPKGTTVKKLSAGKKSFKVKWKKQTVQTNGYQIMYALNEKFTNGKKALIVNRNNTVTQKVKGLKAKKVYYVRVRTYKTVNGKKYYSSWSKAKRIKVK